MTGQELLELAITILARDTELATLKAEVAAFERAYVIAVGRKYVELDEIQAQIAEFVSQAHPENQEYQKRAQEARERAHGSSEEGTGIPTRTRLLRSEIPEDVKKIYREIAKVVHPDLARDDQDRFFRERLMADANQAYEAGDKLRLEAILQDCQQTTKALEEGGSAVKAVERKVRLSAMRHVLASTELQIAEIKASALYEIKKRVESTSDGLHLLDQLAQEIESQIVSARNRLATLRQHYAEFQRGSS